MGEKTLGNGSITQWPNLAMNGLDALHNEMNPLYNDLIHLCWI
jgi:hypothetical protein